MKEDLKRDTGENKNPLSSFKIGWTKKRKYKKKYYIFHFYFCLGSYCWWSIHYKVRGNKRIKPEKLIMKEPRKEEINYYPYNLSPDLMDGWVWLNEKRWNEIMTELGRRNMERKEKLERCFII